MNALEEKRLKDLVDELAAKIRLERQFAGEVGSMFGRLAKDFRSTFAITGAPTSERRQKPTIIATLDRHIRRVQNVASKLELDLAAAADPDTIDDLVGAASTEWRETTVEQSSSRIAETNARQMSQAVDLAREELEGGVERRSLAMRAGAILGRLFGRRVKPIAQTTTQGAFEATKQIKAEATAGLIPFPLSSIFPGLRPPPDRKPMKEWRTVGDERVRKTHVKMNGVLIPVDQLFHVGQKSLMRFPTDTSFGADLEEIINCRCSAIYRNG